MDSRGQVLQKEFADRWSALEAEEARPDEVSWFAGYVALMFEVDQRYRMLLVDMLDNAATADGLADFKHIVRRADHDHQRRLQLWLAGRSWPSNSDYTSDTCEHAWMIALHADNNIEFQELVLRSMTPMLKAGTVAAVHYAALFDRIAIGKEKPQRYGMFYRVEDGKEFDYPTESPDQLQSRRSELGLDDKRFRR